MIAGSAIKNDIKHIEKFFKYATIGIVITDRFGIINAINPFALNELGYSKNELVGKKIEILIPERFREMHNGYHEAYHHKPINRLMAAGKDLFARRKNGTEIAVEISLSNYILQDEQFVVAFINNVTLHKKAEAKIKKLNEELEATVETRTREFNKALTLLKAGQATIKKAILFQKALLDNAGAMIIATDKKGVIKFFNPEASIKLGYRKNEVIDKITPIHFHDKTEIELIRNACLEKFGTLIPGEFEVLLTWTKKNINEARQYTYVRKNGTTFPVSLTITTVRNGNGRVIGYMGVAFDVTEQKQKDEALYKLLEKEKDLSELKSRFITMASHEFRTPLSTVLSSAYLIEKYTKTADQLQREKHLRRITSSVSMLTDILNDFLSLGKLEEGKIPVRLNHFKIPAVINEIIDEIQETLQKGQKIVYEHTGPAQVELDQSLLKHIVLNLISNASKFSPEKSLIAIRTEKYEDHLVLAIKDRGIGISKDDQKHLMERFFRGANAGNVQGTGLGLHIVSKYAELMNGTVICNSQLEKGTEFIITFQTKNQGHEKDPFD